MGNVFCKDSSRGDKSFSKHSFKSGMILERIEINVFDEYDYIEKLGEGSISTVSSIKRKDPHAKLAWSKLLNTCFGSSSVHSHSSSPHQNNNQVSLIKRKDNTIHECDTKESNKNDKCFGFIDVSNLIPKKDIISVVDESSIRSNGSANGRNKIYALKEIDLKCICEEYTDELRNEVDILRGLDHPNIAKAYETYEYRRKLYLVMEYCSGGDLHSRIPYTEKQSCQIVRKILLAVSYMHDKGIVHRDLKYENIMFESNQPDAEIKIIDFGLARKFLPHGGEQFTEKVGTLYTMAPEVIKGKYSEQADAWSIGVIAFMLLSNKKPFWGLTKRELVANIMACKYDFSYHRWKRISKEAQEFVSSLLQLDPNNRATVNEALESKWIVANEPLRSSIPKNITNCFVTFGKNALIKKLALVIIAHKSTADEIYKMRQMFESFDTTKSGRITFEEFVKAFKKEKFSENDLHTMFDSADTFGDGFINYTEFLAATMECQGQIDNGRVEEVFHYLDRDDSGFISKEDLKRFLHKSYSEDLIDQIIAEVDTNKDNQISLQEFQAVFKSPAYGFK